MGYIHLVILIILYVVSSKVIQVSRFSICNPETCTVKTSITMQVPLAEGSIGDLAVVDYSGEVVPLTIRLKAPLYICSFNNVYRTNKGICENKAKGHCFSNDCDSDTNSFCNGKSMCQLFTRYSDTCLGGVRGRICYGLAYMKDLDHHFYYIADTDDKSCLIDGSISVRLNEEEYSFRLDFPEQASGNISIIYSPQINNDFIPNDRFLVFRARIRYPNETVGDELQQKMMGCRQENSIKKRELTNSYVITDSWFLEKSRFCLSTATISCKQTIYLDLETDSIVYEPNIESLHRIYDENIIQNKWVVDCGSHDVTDALIDSKRLEHRYGDYTFGETLDRIMITEAGEDGMTFTLQLDNIFYATNENERLSLSLLENSCTLSTTSDLRCYLKFECFGTGHLQVRMLQSSTVYECTGQYLEMVVHTASESREGIVLKVRTYSNNVYEYNLGVEFNPDFDSDNNKKDFDNSSHTPPSFPTIPNIPNFWNSNVSDLLIASIIIIVIIIVVAAVIIYVVTRGQSSGGVTVVNGGNSPAVIPYARLPRDHGDSDSIEMPRKKKSKAKSRSTKPVISDSSESDTPAPSILDNYEFNREGRTTKL